MLITLMILLTAPAYSDTTQENGSDSSYQNLGLKNAEVIQISEEESIAGQRDNVNGFEANVERSDPKARAAIRKAMRDQNWRSPQPGGSADLNSALDRARALPSRQKKNDSVNRAYELQSGEVETAPENRN